jgi:tetratricopeptide (TPR) repeat protein
MHAFIQRIPFLVLSLSLILVFGGCSTIEEKDLGLYEGLGDYHRSITTRSGDSQALFDQGMQLMYGFNHDDAIRSFHASVQHDSTAAMPWWGIAYAHGININDPAMTDERSRLAREAADKALHLIGNVSEVEAALIQAVSKRYEYPAPENRRRLDEAYVNAMEEVYRKFPDDQEVGTLFADALMNLQPWDYWNQDGTPKGRTKEIVEVLENTLAHHPDHPGANHFYIHAVEASQNPERAVPAADRLRTLVPGAGHLVHMPSHIYIRVGRYADAVRSNQDAVAADRHYFETAPKPKMYAIYYAHNLHFLAYAAMMAGDYEKAIMAARDLEREMPEEPLKAFAGLIEGIMPTTFHVMIRFGKWEEILEEPDYPEYRRVSRAVRRYARSVALSSLGRTVEARSEMDAFNRALEEVPKDWMIFNNSVNKVLPIAKAMVDGELLWREGRVEEAFSKLRVGIKAEDQLIYDEPPGWMIPVRHAYGALLMKNGQAQIAEKVYLEDLERNRNNGWSLVGLQQTYLAQGKTEQAKALESKIQSVWPDHLFRPTSSCYCEPGG